MRKVAQAVGISPGALHKYIDGGYVSLPAPRPLDSSLLLQPDGIREAIFAAELLTLLPRDRRRQGDPFREAVEALRRVVTESADLDQLIVLLTGREVRFLTEQDLHKRLRSEVLALSGRVVLLALGRRHREVMAKLREMQPRGPEKA
ncbi:MAG: hypothetical protein ACK47B_18860 [Armatimonadota bacterium]